MQIISKLEGTLCQQQAIWQYEVVAGCFSSLPPLWGLGLASGCGLGYRELPHLWSSLPCILLPWQQPTFILDFLHGRGEPFPTMAKTMRVI